ncbi:MAG: squalene synthase HpnC [Planctomycetaceae bacterium]|nr:squalene synthase HpnC [Planctomycetaceae bacterium]
MLERLREDLELWGPDVSERGAVSLEQARRYTESVAKSHYENFPVVSWLLPASMRQPFFDVYAFCRWSDDLADELGSQELSLRMLAWWREELTACFAGQAVHPVYVALKQTAADYSLPEKPFHDLITAFERDQSQPRYESFEDLVDYCQYSANPVGRILLHLMDCADEKSLELSDSMCTGLQLINFWQDVARDWEIGRVYLPQQDMQKYGVTEQMIQSKQSNQQFIELMKFQVDRAEQYLKNGLELGNRVPGKMRFDIRLFALGGLCLCDKIRAINYRVLEQRPKVSKFDLPKLVWRAWRGK